MRNWLGGVGASPDGRAAELPGAERVGLEGVLESLVCLWVCAGELSLLGSIKFLLYSERAR